MKIGEHKPVGGVTKIARTGAASKAAAGTAGQARPAVDSATIMGIPEAELSPKVQAAIQSLMEEVAKLREELDQSRKRISYLEQLADQDALVPVINRRAFVRELSRMMSYSERYGSASSVLFFDIDDMKAINDTHGHAAGDAALSRVVEVLLESVRESDVVGRLGGDEFGVILAQADEAQAQEKATLLTSKITASPLVWQDNLIPLSISSGTYTFRGGEGADAALHAADRAMYREKRSHRG